MSDPSSGGSGEEELAPSSVLDAMLSGLGLAEVPPAPRATEGDTELAIDQDLDERYHVTGMLFRRQGVVAHRARDRLLDRPVVLKMMVGDTTKAVQEVARMELLLARSLSHPNICRVHDLTSWRDHPILVMEGANETLRQRLDAYRVSRWPEADEIRGVFNGLASAVALIHQQGLVHGALNPDNILMSGETPKLLFGPATTRERLITGSTTQQLAAVDSAYFSPERLSDGHTSRWDDIYALGLMLWEQLGRATIELGTSPTAEPMLQRMPASVATRLAVTELRTLFDMLEEDLSRRPPARKLRLRGQTPAAPRPTDAAGTPPPAIHDREFEPGEQGLLVTCAPENSRIIGAIYPLQAPELTIGRAADIAIKASTLSKRHARLTWAGGSWRVKDLESTNGTFVDHGYEGRASCILRHAEEIQMGEVRLRLVSFEPRSIAHWQARRQLKVEDGLTGYLLPQHFLQACEREAEFADWTGFGAWILRLEIEHRGRLASPVAMLATRRAAQQVRLLTTRSWPGTALFGLPAGHTASSGATLGCVLVGRSRDDPERLVEHAVAGTRRLMPPDTSVRASIFRREYGESMSDTLSDVLA